jgi:hypothetical protein
VSALYNNTKLVTSEWISFYDFLSKDLDALHSEEFERKLLLNLSYIAL